MRSTVILPILAGAGVLFAVWTVLHAARPVPAAQPVAEPAHPAAPAALSGSGIVESASEEIAIGSPLGGIVAEVMALPDATVAAGAPLFRLDDRAARAQCAVAAAQLAAAQAQLDRLAGLPRREDLAVAEARLASAATARREAEAVWAFYAKAPDAVSAEQGLRQQYAAAKARDQEAEAQRAVELIRAGAWPADLAVAKAQVATAAAQLQAAQTEAERLTVRAPIGGSVLQVKVRPGEFAAAAATAPLVLLGDTRILHVRVDIDEHEAWRLQPGATAEACVRGNPALRTALRFVRIEPYVIPKKSLSNDPGERVDTRVLQVIFACDRGDLPIRVGQQLDVFIAGDR